MDSTWSSTTQQEEHGDKDKPYADCDLKGFDDLNCKVAGIAAEADYMKKYQDKLTERRAKFDAARSAYEQARTAVAADVTAIGEQIERIGSQLECQVNEKDSKCLKEAWEEVRKQLDRCGGDRGCCVTPKDCNFDTPYASDEDDSGEEADDKKAAQIQVTIAEFEKRVTKAEKCFDDVMIKEPDALKGRVKDLKDFVEQIGNVSSDPKKGDYARAYAQLLWARQRLSDLWRGFANANDYSDCLCLALNCSLVGRRTLSKLTGTLTALNCRSDREAARCTWLKTHVVDEIIAICRRKRPPDKPDGNCDTTTAV
jgi:hypothetical protein